MTEQNRYVVKALESVADGLDEQGIVFALIALREAVLELREPVILERIEDEPDFIEPPVVEHRGVQSFGRP